MKKRNVTILILIVCFYKGAELKQCKRCECCKRRRCFDYNFISDYCVDGCIDGYFGNHCLYACSSNCMRCTDRYSCTKCKDGFYSGRYPGDDHGFYHNDCRHQCKPNCKICSSYNTCTACKDGVYNGKQFHNSSVNYKDCRHSCYYNCKSCSSYYTCNECKNGFYNNPHVENGIQSSNCAYQCGNACHSCTSDTNCSGCYTGYYLDYSDALNQQCKKCERDCRSCSSADKCTLCVDGKYGISCEHNCSHGCLQGHCVKENGHCNCKLGFWGDKCDHSCPPNCLKNTCNKNTGRCVACNHYFIGDKCNKCAGGKYGQNCNMNCPYNCANNNCTRNGTCVSCKPIRYGKYCRCSLGCDSDSCSSNGGCSRCKQSFTGKKCERCSDGKFGQNCDQNCPKSCLACTSLDSCSACVAKHWGDACQSCPNNCLNCSNNSLCSSCEDGFYGSTCTEKCSENCNERRCNQMTGHCSVGCKNSFYGDLCDSRCNQNCRNYICDRIYGQCTQGCKAGFYGKNCTQSLQITNGGDNKRKSIIGSVVGVVLLILAAIFIIIIVIFVKRRTRDNQNKHDTIALRLDSERNTHNPINGTNLATKNKSKNRNERNEMKTYRMNDSTEVFGNTQETDAIYAKPIKQKGKEMGVISLNISSKTETTDNTNSEEKNTDDDQTTGNAKGNECLKHFRDVNDKTSRTIFAKIPAINKIHNGNDTELEIEEGLLSKSYSTILEDEIRKVAELDPVDTYDNVGDVLKRKIKVEKLSDFVSKKTDTDFADEFQTLPAMLIKPYVESQKRQNVSKNRYKGIYPYDDTRVVLKDGVSDYINASYIDGYKKNKAYIASIGPTTRYMGDMSAFWIMAWQEKVEKIVMLTNISEGGVPKCDKYWPDKDLSLTFGNIQVTCINEEEYSDYTFRTFTVQKKSVIRKIFHIHFTAWPDKGTPDDVTSLIEFRQKVVSTKTRLDGPLLVHCSAGIGRTGTYIALDGITKEGKAEGEVDIFAFVRNMREQRVNMIQTAEQYKYLHNALVHTLTFDSEAIEASMFSDYMKTHTEDHLRKLFEKFQESMEQRSDNEKEAVTRNKTLKDKNRKDADIPGDRNRPRLYIARSAGSSDYINAVYVNSFQNVNRFLIAQTPLPETVEDILTLIVQEKVSCIISMETSSPNDKNVGVYYPVDNKTLKKGAFTVKTECGNGTDQYLSQKLKISYSSKSGSEDVSVPYIQFTQWGKGSTIPEEPSKFVQFIKDIEHKFGGIDKKRPILVHCSTGSVRSGLFCVVSNLLEKTQIDQRVSVVNTVRQIKSRRHMAVPNKDQFIFCHQCVNEYLRTFDTYSNFELKT